MRTSSLAPRSRPWCPKLQGLSTVQGGKNVADPTCLPSSQCRWSTRPRRMPGCAPLAPHVPEFKLSEHRTVSTTYRFAATTNLLGEDLLNVEARLGHGFQLIFVFLKYANYIQSIADASLRRASPRCSPPCRAPSCREWRRTADARA